jgi:sensor histidine kinase YesM
MKTLGRQLLWCGLAAAAVPVLTYVFTGGRASARLLAWNFAAAYIFSLCIAIPLEYTLHRVAPGLLRRPRWQSAPAFAVVLVAFAVLGTLVGSAIICGVGMMPWRLYGAMFRDAVKVSLLLTAVFGVAGLVTNTLAHRLDESNRKLREKEEDERRARAMATEARLASLESRVHPHFLFNAINSILALIRDEPRRAEDLLERMAALLRFSLDSAQGRLVPLSKELAIARDYLEIEQARFGARLRFRFEGGEDLEAEVPPLSVQTLVENSVKFAVGTRREGGSITVRASGQGGRALVEVEDDGPGFSELDVVKGHGLDLLRERLAGLGDLEFDRQECGMTVRMTLHSAVRTPAPALVERA